MPDIQSVIDHIKSAVDVDPWAAEAAEAALKKVLPMKWVMGKPYRVNCPVCGEETSDTAALTIYKYCYNCGQKCEGVLKIDAE